MSNQWRTSLLIIPLPKKGNTRLCLNYRTISVNSLRLAQQHVLLQIVINEVACFLRFNSLSDFSRFWTASGNSDRNFPSTSSIFCSWVDCILIYHPVFHMRACQLGLALWAHVCRPTSTDVARIFVWGGGIDR